MAGKNLYEGNNLIRESLMTELKSYRNLSVKLATLFWIISLAGHYAYTALNTSALGLAVEDALFESLQFSLVFAIIGYCIGAVVGASIQRKRLSEIAENRESRKKFIEEQIAIRQAKMESF